MNSFALLANKLIAKVCWLFNITFITIVYKIVLPPVRTRLISICESLSHKHIFSYIVLTSLNKCLKGKHLFISQNLIKLIFNTSAFLVLNSFLYRFLYKKFLINYLLFKTNNFI